MKDQWISQEAELVIILTGKTCYLLFPVLCFFPFFLHVLVLWLSLFALIFLVGTHLPFLYFSPDGDTRTSLSLPMTTNRLLPLERVSPHVCVQSKKVKLIKPERRKVVAEGHRVAKTERWFWSKSTNLHLWRWISSGYLLYSTVTIGKNNVLYTWNLLRE